MAPDGSPPPRIPEYAIIFQFTDHNYPTQQTADNIILLFTSILSHNLIIVRRQ